ncbi:MAG: hypothetical protein H5T82_02295, partial [Demequina sp.]|nr:hypothetical protein [Demequina sp.]
MMDLSQRLHSLASDVGNDYAMSAPEDAAALIGKARRGRMVWTSGVGAVAAAGAASLAFGGPAVASVLSGGDTQLAPAGTTSESTSTDESVTTTESDDAFETESSDDSTPPTTTSASAPGGVIDLTGGKTGEG